MRAEERRVIVCGLDCWGRYASGLAECCCPVCANEAQAYFTVNALADEAQDYYATNVEALVQGKCIVCHRAGGQAASSGADLLFTSSVASNHAAFDAM